MFWPILAGGAMPICDHGGNKKWLFHDDFNLPKTCQKGKKAFFGNFSTFDHVGYIYDITTG